MQSYDEVARKEPKKLTRKLHLGIPTAIRGMVWQLMCKGKDPALEMTFTNLLTRTSTHEKLIQRDLARTFPKHEYFQEDDGSGQEALFNVVKAYSLYDPEVGYCQGISFIVGPLLLNVRFGLCHFTLMLIYIFHSRCLKKKHSVAASD